MAFSRYTRTPYIANGSQLGTMSSINTIRTAIKDGKLSFVKQITTKGSQRLDTIAGEEFNDGRYWWILAACSDIGWGMQIPPGTILNIPRLEDIARLVG